MSEPINKVSVPEKILYEELMQRVCGFEWKELHPRERDGAWGVAIVKSVLDGVRPSLTELSSHLGIPVHFLKRAFHNLAINGVLLNNFIHNDLDLKNCEQSRRDATKESKEGKPFSLYSSDPRRLFPWYYYAGMASGFVGISLEKNGS